MTGITGGEVKRSCAIIFRSLLRPLLRHTHTLKKRGENSLNRDPLHRCKDTKDPLSAQFSTIHVLQE